MKDANNTYSKGLKGIAVFGSLQIYKILVSMITTKISAIFLGPIGVGIYGLLTSTLTTIESITSCGLGTSAIKEIANAKESDNGGFEISRVYIVLKKLCLLSGIVGTIFCAVASGWLSRMAFGNDDYTWCFVVLSITLIFSQLISAQGALLTGLGKLKSLFRLRMSVSTVTMIFSVALYYFYGAKGIVPVILLSSVTYITISSIITNNVSIDKISVSLSKAKFLIKSLLKTGFALSLSYSLVALTGYLLRIYISNVSDTAMVGLFVSSFALVNTYLGLLFSSIESDFYPRLSSSTRHYGNFTCILREELELVILLIVPLVVVLMVYAQPVLAIFYSDKFYAAKDLIIWSALSMAAKIPGWICSVGLISIGKNKSYMINQITYTIYQLILNILGFKYAGLFGLGLSFFIGQSLYSIQTVSVINGLGVKFLDRNSTILMLLLISGAILCAVLVTMLSGYLQYIVGTMVIVILLPICYYQLDKRIHIGELIKEKLFNHKK